MDSSKLCQVRPSRFTERPMKRLGIDWGEIEGLPPDAHLHLDKLLDEPPGAGSESWLPIVREVAAYLAERGGNWTVTLPIGAVASVPAPIPDAAGAFDFIDERERAELPAVYRLPERLTPHSWEGEHHLRRTRVTPVVAEVVSYGRASNAAPDEGGFRAAVVEEVRAGRQ